MRSLSRRRAMSEANREIPPSPPLFRPQLTRNPTKDTFVGFFSFSRAYRCSGLICCLDILGGSMWVGSLARRSHSISLVCSM